MIGDGTKIIQQYPNQNTQVTSKDKVFLITNGKNLKMINLTGWSTKEAETYLDLVGVKYKLEGNGYVTSQSIPEGTVLTNDLEVVLTLAPKYDLEEKEAT